MSSHPIPEHKFSQFIRILGRGKKSTRSLTFNEAREAMTLILEDKVEPEQIGAFLMLLRVKEESPEEVAGFISSIRHFIAKPQKAISVDLDWSSYSGKKKQAPWFLLAVFALSNSGVRILMHGSAGHTENRIYTSEMLHALGHNIANSWTDIEQQLNSHSFSYISLANLNAGLERLIHLKPLLGLRSPMNTLVRLINPCSAPHSISSVFHPAYATIQTQAQDILAQPNFCVFKGDGGEIEARPEADTKVISLSNKQQSNQVWPRLSTNKSLSQAPLSLDACAQSLKDMWQGKTNDAYANQSIQQTLNICVQLLNPNLSQTECHEQAAILWQKRNLTFI